MSASVKPLARFAFEVGYRRGTARWTEDGIWVGMLGFADLGQAVEATAVPDTPSCRLEMRGIGKASVTLPEDSSAPVRSAEHVASCR
jgi:hypothetical protein